MNEQFRQASERINLNVKMNMRTGEQARRAGVRGGQVQFDKVAHRKQTRGMSRFAAALLSFAVSILPANAFVYENPHEFTATGDFDGDGRQDMVIVDKTTGNYRVAHQLAPGLHTWAGARASGIENVSGFALGHLIATTRDTLAFTAPDANRINVLEANNPSVAGLPLSVFTPAIGPNLVVALDVGGAGNTTLDDLFVGSIYNGASPNLAT